jgi:outer membrane immunogenic protein
MIHQRTVLAALAGIGFGLATVGAQASVFEGGYVGGQIGGSVYDIDSSIDGVGRLSGLSATGFTAGVFGGFGWVSDGDVFAGIELHTSYEDADSSLRIDGEGTLSVEARHSYGASVRIGTLPTDHVLVYGLLGYEQTRVRSRARGSGFENVSESDDISGPRIGLGVEIQRDSPWFMRGEVSYTAYSSERYLDTTIDPGATRVQIGLGYRF